MKRIVAGVPHITEPSPKPINRRRLSTSARDERASSCDKQITQALAEIKDQAVRDWLAELLCDGERADGATERQPAREEVAAHGHAST
jgi:hypothetical protein